MTCHVFNIYSVQQCNSGIGNQHKGMLWDNHKPNTDTQSLWRQYHHLGTCHNRKGFLNWYCMSKIHTKPEKHSKRADFCQRQYSSLLLYAIAIELCLDILYFQQSHHISTLTMFFHYRSLPLLDLKTYSIAECHSSQHWKQCKPNIMKNSVTWLHSKSEWVPLCPATEFH